MISNYYYSPDLNQSSASGRGKKSLDFSTPTTRRLKQTSNHSKNGTLTPSDSPDTNLHGLDDSFATPLERSLTAETELGDAVAKNHGIVADSVCKSRKRMQDEVFGELSDDDDMLTNIDPGKGKFHTRSPCHHYLPRHYFSSTLFADPASGVILQQKNFKKSRSFKITTVE